MTANENKSKFVRSVVIEADFINLFGMYHRVIVFTLHIYLLVGDCDKDFVVEVDKEISA